MSDEQKPFRPAWQTDELEDEWIEQEPEDTDEDYNLTYGTRSISFTAPLATTIHTNSEVENSPYPTASPQPVGTVLVREDVPAGPIIPKTPGRNNQRGIIKDFFSPLPLERMFEPPSPPATSTAAAPQPLSQLSEINGKDDGKAQEAGPFAGLKPSMDCKFTFAVPRDNSLNPQGASSGAHPQAQSTPNPPFPATAPAPMTDPRLRLFQFQYDTFTRDHLSAMVDSIAVNTPSADSGMSPVSPMMPRLSRVSEVTGTNAPSVTNFRSAKRIKLNPKDGCYGEGAGADAVVIRPKKDYVGESRSLMQKIKQARDFSTISTVATARSSPASERRVGGGDLPEAGEEQPSPQGDRPSRLCVPESTDSSTSAGGSTSTRSGPYSSSTYREQAAALMAQIRNDMKGQKRLFSGDTEFSQITTRFDTSMETAASHLTEGKEGRNGNQHHRTMSVKSNGSARSRHSTARKKAGTADAAIAKLARDVSKMDIHDHGLPTVLVTIPTASTVSASTIQAGQPLPTRVPSAYPSSSIRSGTNEDLNRFVSSSTASGTTLTSGTAPSFVKHAGPMQIRTIAPQDVPALPDRVGKMVYDRVMMRWIKSTALVADTAGDDGELRMEADESEDPFRDIDSLDDTEGRDQLAGDDHLFDPPVVDGMSRIDEQSEVGDEEEAELTSFSFDNPSAGVVQVMTGVETDDADDETSDSDDQHDPITQTEFCDDGFDTDDDLQQSDLVAQAQGQVYDAADAPTITPAVLTVQHSPSTPAPGGTAIRSALKSESATPTSAMKDPNRSRHRTPVQKHKHRRSVSFSDGKRDGPIVGLNRNMDDGLAAAGSSALAGSSPVGTASSFMPSIRSRRITDMMNALEDTGAVFSVTHAQTTGDPKQYFSLLGSEDSSPSKMSTAPGRLQPLAVRQPNSGGGNISRRVVSQSQTRKTHRGNQNTKSEATFLTECSFGVTHDRLVQVITDVEPFEPHWEDLSHIDLSDKKVESVARLKEFLPRLDSLKLNSNQLSWLSGVPGTVRTLSVAQNNLTALTSYSHLLNLENLDISGNDIDSLNQLGCLRHLRELRADANKITSLDGLQRMEGLVKLSLQGNCIRTIDLAQYRWSRLEMLNLSHNRLDNISGLASLLSLIALNVDNNSLEALGFGRAMPRLRILRASGNRLHQLDVALLPNVRTLYADNNSLTGIEKVDRLTKLENLSLRNQSGRGLNLVGRDVRDVKRLYMSGNPLHKGFLELPCYNLVYLELAACRLTSLPEDMGRLVPNLRVLNLNYNFLEDAGPLAGLTRLRKLTIIGSRLKGTKALIRILQRMPEVEMVDFRMNPCTLGWYLPLLVKDVPGALQPSEGNGRDGKAVKYGWLDLDSKFRRDLPDEAYIGRLAYRGLIMRACPVIRMLDGVEVSEKERAKAHRLLEGILAKR